MRTWADDAGIVPPARTIDRDAGEGPQPRCCAVSHVAADELVWYGPSEMSAGAHALVRGRFPHMPGSGMYLCGGCRETLRREKVVARTEMPTSRPLARLNEK